MLTGSDEDYVDAVDYVAAEIVVAATEITTNAGCDSSDEVEAFSIQRVSWPKMILTIRNVQNIAAPKK
jgi:hypothetical protein